MCLSYHRLCGHDSEHSLAGSSAAGSLTKLLPRYEQRLQGSIQGSAGAGSASKLTQ